MDVLISNAWGRVPYNATRSLATHHLSVVVGTDRFLGMAALSRHSTATFRHPFVTTDPEGFVDCVKKAFQRYSPKVYLPMGEDTYIVAKYVDDLRSFGVKIPVAPYQTIKRLHRKDEVMELARSLGIPIPETIVPRNVDEVRTFSGEGRARVVLKRTSSSSARGVLYGTGEEIADAWSRESRDLATPLTEFVVQQYVHGTGYGVSMLFNHGELRAKFTHKRLKEIPATGGTSIVRIGVVHPELEAYAQRLLESVNFHGVAMVEFKHNEETGESWLLEVNPRFWGSLALAIRSGVDFPYLLFRLASEGDIDPVFQYRTGVVVKWLLGDLAAAFSRSSTAGSFRVGRPLGPECYDDFDWDDPLAFLGGAVLAVRKLLATRSWRHDEFNLNLERLERLQGVTGG